MFNKHISLTLEDVSVLESRRYKTQSIIDFAIKMISAYHGSFSLLCSHQKIPINSLINDLENCLKAVRTDDNSSANPELGSWAYAYLCYRLQISGRPIRMANLESPRGYIGSVIPEIVAYETLLPMSRSNSGDGMPQIVRIVLNGGIGTTMKCDMPKTSMQVFGPKRTFLAIIADQCIAQNTKVLFFNSEFTSKMTMEWLRLLPDGGDLFDEVRQSFFPRIETATGLPLDPTQFPELTQKFCPFGHGAIYSVLAQTENFAKLVGWIHSGVQLLLVSNGDNLGAIFDEKVFGAIVKSHCPFAMEVVTKTELDVKGSIPVWLREENCLGLAELSSATPELKAEIFDRVSEEFPIFNTNTLWIDPLALAVLIKQYGCLPLPLIVNHKTVTDKNEAVRDVVQLESSIASAMMVFDRLIGDLIRSGDYISILTEIGLATEANIKRFSEFEAVRLVQVSRDRFVPVKTGADLERLRANYREGDDHRIVLK